MKEIKKKFARILRKDETRSENILWEFLRNRKFMDLKFRRQHVIEGFVVDFYCHELRIGIEVDGSIHAKRKEYDKIRQEIIESKGIRIIRIANKEVTKNKTATLLNLKKIIESLPIPLPLGEDVREKVTSI